MTPTGDSTSGSANIDTYSSGGDLTISSFTVDYNEGSSLSGDITACWCADLETMGGGEPE